MMRFVWILFAGHLIALIFGLAGILIALPNPQLWIDSPYGPDIFRFGLEYGGSMHIWWGALTMLLFGGLTIGWRKTLIFFAVAFSVSLSSELIGTTTGLPFGDYAYLSGLGDKVLGRVPYTIPLSWFYLGFASFLIANVIAGPVSSWKRSVVAIAGGAYFLVVWDLVLDPAMAHESMPIQFWSWSDTGPYFGMPLINFAGWALTGAVFMTISRLLWRDDADPITYSPTVPFAVYLANIGFGVVLAISVDLWIPAAIAITFGVLPASLVFVQRNRRNKDPYAQIPTEIRPVESVGYKVMNAVFNFSVNRNVELRIEGMHHIPENGPAMLAARHYHHLFDGAILMTRTQRPLHILVGLDWISRPIVRSVMEKACQWLRWPVVLRHDSPVMQQGKSAYRAEEELPMLREAVADSVELLRSGELMLMFPEAYPNVDPAGSVKTTNEFLSFQTGYLRIVRNAEHDGQTTVPIIPVGFDYQQDDERRFQRVTMRVGSPIYLDSTHDLEEINQSIEQTVRALSQPQEVAQPAIAGELITS